MRWAKLDVSFFVYLSFNSRLIYKHNLITQNSNRQKLTEQNLKVSLLAQIAAFDHLLPAHSVSDGPNLRTARRGPGPPRNALSLLSH